MKNSQLTTISVYSEVEDNNLQKNMNDSPIWKKCYHREDVPSGFKGFEYKIGFNGTKPVQLMNKTPFSN